MMVGAIGICLGLALFGPKLIRTVGSEITELDQTRAFCIAMSATITFIARALAGVGRSAHIAVGGVFGVGFLQVDISIKLCPHGRRHCSPIIRTTMPSRSGTTCTASTRRRRGKGCHARPAEA
jgi:phosphate/sulfate permease